LTISKPSRIRSSVDEETTCLNFLVGICGATVFAKADNRVLGTRSTFVAIGDRFPCTVEVAVSITDGPPRDDLYRNGNIYHHSVTFKVADLDHARAHLRAVGIGLETDHRTMIVTDPADTNGLRFGFTTSLADGYPRAAALGPHWDYDSCYRRRALLAEGRNIHEPLD
jgi:hypothetical protein